MRPELLASFASAFTQAQRLLTLELGDGSHFPGQLLPQSVVGEEALSSPYRYRLRCLSPDAAIELKYLLGLPTAFGIVDAGGGTVRRCGVISEVKRLAADGGFAAYELTVEPPLALLRHRHTSRVFQDLPVPDIVESVLAEHRAANPVFAAAFELRFDLARTYPSRSYCLQYRESDLAFITRLLAEEGIGYRFEHGRGEMPHVACVGFDDPYRLPRSAQGNVRFHRADATEAEDSLTAWDAQRRLGPAEAALASYDYRRPGPLVAVEAAAVEQGADGTRAEASLQDYDAPGLYYGRDGDELARYARLRQQAHDGTKKRFSGEGTVRALEAGHWFVLAGHPAHEQDPPETREFVVTALRFTAHNNLPDPLSRALGASAPTPYRASFDAQRRGLPLVPEFAHTPHARPTAAGPQTATVVGLASEEIHTDVLGRVKVQFHWQRPAEHPSFGANFDERSSCWLRVAYPSAGAQWGHQFIPRIGQEVLVDFLEGDIDRPLVVAVLHNALHPPPTFSGAGSLPANRALSGIKSKEYQGSGYNELLFDDSTAELRARLSSEHAKTQLNLGWLGHPRTDGRVEPRGEGAELRTDAALALRAAEGVLISADGRPGASGGQLDRAELVGLTRTLQSIVDQLGGLAETHQAGGTDGTLLGKLVDRLQNWEQGTNTGTGSGGGAPVVAVSAPEGIALASADNVLIGAQQHIDLACAGNTQISAGRRLLMRATELISGFAHRGIQLIAATEKLQLVTHKDDLELVSARRIVLTAADEIVLQAPRIRQVAQGAQVEVGGGAIVQSSSGAHQIRSASFSQTGPAGGSVPGMNLPTSIFTTDEKFVLRMRNSGLAVVGRRYCLELDDGTRLEGRTDEQGQTSLAEADVVRIARLTVFDD